jgi:NADP-dependent 3-hydroxy acid dehydrogenase YdfG
VDKVVIVTGASSGLGPGMAGLFAAEGARVVPAARRIDLVHEAAHASGEAAFSAQIDVSQEAGVSVMVRAHRRADFGILLGQVKSISGAGCRCDRLTMAVG